ncbi:MAG: RidA family protein [Elusimicrobia bacterium]|nr:RidA family protein [Elusimicrobiota bacterium]
MTKQAVVSREAPAAIGPYSQAVIAGGMVFVSGQIPIDPGTGALVEGGVRAQTEIVIKNLGAVLKAAGLDLPHVVKTTVYMKNLSEFQAMNEVYGKYFREPYPARATIEVSNLPKGALVEIEVIAIH